MFAEYHAYKVQYLHALRKLNALIDEREAMYQMTQPGAIRYDKERLKGGKFRNVFEEYLIAKEESQIEERIEEQKQILEQRRQIKELMERELRASKDWFDKIYCYRYIDRLSIRQIEKRIPYSRSQIGRFLEKIRQILNE